MLTFAEARSPDLLPAVQAEAARLLALGTPGVVVPPAFEEAFYRGGNLPEQLRRLFAPIRPARIDEDALEPLAAQAQTLIRTSYLMDDAVQAFYRALARANVPGGARMRVRRADEVEAEEVTFLVPGTAALQAVKRVWARDWTFEAVLDRLDRAGSVALEARPTLLHATG
ncbi:hypothetical protein [Deinococcus radiotolerans]|uniref:Uncharacterized protein n=1 Tax=Deinococcus radiotolerans TaxID=1309407 RepID=A0ABQ2FMH5_9DEIO|nr:hypothetical protein [Deinococcus radiotolerans]GGL06939.1 hypothetical protein GCM10010844_27180 [Deinococcus radiotolerans]